MKINTGSNSYIIIYSVVLVVVVAFMLAFVSQALKPAQDVNVALDKKKQILAALGIKGLANDEAAAKYAEVVVADRVINEGGQTIAEGTKGGEKAAFVLTSADYKAGRLALYVCNVGGREQYVVPLYGMGLWGPIWGYVAVDEDKNTVVGAYFNHESETAGLGAEIKDNAKWQKQFEGKKIYAADGSGTVMLKVLKKSKITHPESECDGVTGATLTTDGVSAMLVDGFGKYKAFFSNSK